MQKKILQKTLRPLRNVSAFLEFEILKAPFHTYLDK